MAGESGYVTGGPGAHGDHVIVDRPDLTAHMFAISVCGVRTATATVLGYKLDWLPRYGGCVNCMNVLGGKK